MPKYPQLLILPSEQKKEKKKRKNISEVFLNSLLAFKNLFYLFNISFLKDFRAGWREERKPPWKIHATIIFISSSPPLLPCLSLLHVRIIFFMLLSDLTSNEGDDDCCTRTP